MATLIGLPDYAGSGSDVPAPINRFNGQMIRRMQADPMWSTSNVGVILLRPRQRIRHLALSALGLLMAPEQLEETVRYERFLCDLSGWSRPHGHT
jgi:hypothetical protein